MRISCLRPVLLRPSRSLKWRNIALDNWKPDSGTWDAVEIWILGTLRWDSDPSVKVIRTAETGVAACETHAQGVYIPE